MTAINPKSNSTLLGDIQMKAVMSCLAVALSVCGCTNDAQIASSNLSKAADNFEINRRIVFYNGITGEYMLSIEGLCSLDISGAIKATTVTCKTGENTFKKHYLGISDNVTFFAEQIDPAKAGVSQYRVTFKPMAIIPDVDVRK